MILGIVKNGVVVPQNDTPLPDGARTEVLDQWDKASDEAWAMIDQWEVEER